MNQTPTPELDAAALAHLQQWINRSETLHDTIGAAPLHGLAATLDRDDAPLARGDAVPPLGHWLHFLPQARQSQLGPDGHPSRGGSPTPGRPKSATAPSGGSAPCEAGERGGNILPPVPLPRRMWAAGRLSWEPGNPLRVGDEAHRHSRIESVTHKRGRSGEMVFVQVRHEVHNAHGLCVSEEQDLVYRAAPQPGESPTAPTPAPTGAAWQREIVPDDVLLFRYSALTFNSHRIHYDRRYVTEVEGYPSLVVHGPLIATLLVDLVRRHAPQRFVRRFDFRAVRPTFDLHPFCVNGAPSADGQSVQLWANDHDG
jgi:3-methylfumaryl-CoA hydratase